MAKPTGPVILASTSLTSGIVAAWPLTEGTGNAVDVVGGVTLDCTGSGVSWNSSPVGLLTVGSPSRATVACPSSLQLYPSTQPAISVLWIGKVLGTLGAFGAFCGVFASAGPSLYGAILNSGTNGNFQWNTYTNGQTGSATVTNGTTYNLIWIQNVGVLTGYISGSSDASKSVNLSGGISYAGSPTICLGTPLPTSLTAACNVRHDVFVIWNRLLGSTEITALVSDPWQIFVPAGGPVSAALLPAM